MKHNARKACSALLLLTLTLSACQIVQPTSNTPVVDVQLGSVEDESLAPTQTESASSEESPSDSAEATADATAEVITLPTPPEAELGTVGYIDIPNTKVDYPVVLHDDNEFYLTNDSDGKRDYRGAIFMDYRNADPDRRRNIILYGHNMKDQSMFSTLHSFEREGFFKDNDTIDFELFGVKYRYEIVYAGVIDYREYNHISTSFSSEQEFLDYYADGAAHAQFVREGYVPMPGDQMLTLSTCVTHSVKDYNFKRMIVVARMDAVVGVGEYTKPAESFGPAEAQFVLEELPVERSAAMQNRSDQSNVKSDGIAVPGE